MNCSRCGHQEWVRSSRRSLFEYVRSLAGIIPVRCGRCILERRSAIYWRQAVTVGTIGLVMVCMAGYSSGSVRNWASNIRFPVVPQTQKVIAVRASINGVRRILENDDILELKRAGVGSRLLVRLVNTRPCRFRMDPTDILELKKAGGEDELIDAMMAVGERTTPIE